MSDIFIQSESLTTQYETKVSELLPPNIQEYLPNFRQIKNFWSAPSSSAPQLLYQGAETL